MITTVSDYGSTVHVEKIRSEVLENMLIYMHGQVKKINAESVFVENELKRREGI